MPEKVLRRQIVVDRTFQLQFLRIWFLVGLTMVLFSAGFYIFVRKFSGAQRIDPFVLKVLLGMSVFIILFSLLMGTLSIILAHRVAGAAYRIERSLERMIDGDFTETILLRKGDYLTRIAERLNQLQDKVRSRAQEVDGLAQDLTRMRERLPSDDRAELDKLIQRAKSARPV